MGVYYRTASQKLLDSICDRCDAELAKRYRFHYPTVIMFNPVRYGYIIRALVGDGEMNQAARPGGYNQTILEEGAIIDIDYASVQGKRGVINATTVVMDLDLQAHGDAIDADQVIKDLLGEFEKLRGPSKPGLIRSRQYSDYEKSLRDQGDKIEISATPKIKIFDYLP